MLEWSKAETGAGPSVAEAGVKGEVQNEQIFRLQLERVFQGGDLSDLSRV